MTKIILIWIAVAVLVVAMWVGIAFTCKWLSGVFGWPWSGASWWMGVVVMWLLYPRK